MALATESVPTFSAEGVVFCEAERNEDRPEAQEPGRDAVEDRTWEPAHDGANDGTLEPTRDGMNG